MATFVLHANTPCAGKGNVSTLSGPNHSIAVSVAGVGAVFAQFQVWGREDGSEPGKINGLVTVSGTTSATQTVTFTGRYKEIWLELVGISAASTFSATITTLETEFATNAELDAAVAANGGQSLGPSVSVAGVLWDWSATRGRYIPGDAVSFATYAGLPTLTNTAKDIGVKTWLVNPLTPDGMTRMYWTGTLWAPVAGQRLYYAKGVLLDRTADGLSIGAWTEVWQSPILPAWMISIGDPNISVSAEAEISDTVSTALSKLRISLAAAANSGGDENGGLIGVTGATSPYGKGFGGARIRGSAVSGTLYATAGAFPYAPATQPHRTAGVLNSTSTRLRMDAWPGATTNTIKLFSVALWSGE